MSIRHRMMCCQAAFVSPASEMPVAVNRASITAVNSCGTGSSDGAPRVSGLAKAMARRELAAQCCPSPLMSPGVGDVLDRGKPPAERRG